MTAAARPLEGLPVLALERAVAAPPCTARLADADAGARAIEVERPGGDSARDCDHAARGRPSHFLWLERGRESLVAGLAEFARHPALRRATVETPGGPVSLAAPPALRDGSAPVLGAVPALGQHSEALRAEFAEG